jgi:predicted RNA-binding Zn ribbon-like protein
MSSITDISPHFIANNLALDFINSAYGSHENSHDCLVNDQSALAWLKAAGQLGDEPNGPPLGLAELARSLRHAARRLIGGSETERLCYAEVVNQVLEAGRPRRTLAVNIDSNFLFIEQRRDNSPASLLEPIAMELAHLVVKGELSLVRKCEAHDCTLMFLDATKSGRRRWCSMAICGNRMKVAAFRARKDAR